jgi:hypothetical protein
MIATIKRITTGDPFRTFGIMFIDIDPMFITLERPWRNNRTDISCIPPGEYKCRFKNSKKHGPVYEILNVPGRTNILIHKGNKVSHTKGCIIIGSEFGKLVNEPAVLNSTKAHYNFLSWANKRDFDLIIE